MCALIVEALRVRLGLTLVLLSVLVGCASGDKTRIDGSQYLPVDAKLEKKIILLLGNHQTGNQSGEDHESEKGTLLELQREFERCVTSGLIKTNSNTDVFPLHKWHSDIDFDLNYLIASEGLGKKLPHQITQAFNELDIQYLVRIGVISHSSKKQGQVGVMDGGTYDGVSVPVFAVGQSWDKSAQIQATIYEIKSGSLAGELSADLTEDAFWAMPILLIIPLPPVGYSPDIEHLTCKKMGSALGRFFMGAGNGYSESQPASYFDLSGTYVSNKSEYKIVQKGDQIIGTYGYFSSGKFTGEIWGKIEGDTIKLDYYDPGGSTGIGELKVSPDGTELQGTWTSSNRKHSGPWNLKRIE